MFGLQMIREMDNLQREMEQVFSDFGLHPLLNELPQERTINLRDLGDAFQLEASLPGLAIDKLDISVLGRRLTISGEFAAAEVPENAVWHRKERSIGRFEKNLQLSAEVETDQVEAEYSQGILRIKLPKAAAALPKKITLKAS